MSEALTMRERNRPIRPILAAATLMAALYLPATSFGATDFVFSSGNCTGAEEGSLDGTNGNMRTCTSPTDATKSVDLTGWSDSEGTPGSDDKIATAFLGIYGGGLGVTGNDDGDGSSNAHTLDNYGETFGETDGILIEFPGLWALTKVVAGYIVNDSDISVLRYTGIGSATPAATQTWAALVSSGSWALVEHLTNLALNVPRDLNAALQTSTHWFITAANPSSFGTTVGCMSNRCDGYSDKVKISGITGEQPDEGVPEPATLALFAIALLGIAFQRARARLIGSESRGVVLEGRLFA